MICLITCIIVTITLFCIAELRTESSRANYPLCFGLGSLCGLLIWLGVILVGGISVGITNDINPDSTLIGVETFDLCPLSCYDDSYDENVYLEKYCSSNGSWYYHYCIEVDGSYFLQNVPCSDSTISYLKEGYDPVYIHNWRDAPNALWREFSADFAPDDHIFKIAKGSILKNTED